MPHGTVAEHSATAGSDRGVHRSESDGIVLQLLHLRTYTTTLPSASSGAVAIHRQRGAATAH
jgi:hypothetical protein